MKSRYENIKPTYIKINPEDTNLGDLVINQIRRTISKCERNNICSWKRKRNGKKKLSYLKKQEENIKIYLAGEKGDDLPF